METRKCSKCPRYSYPLRRCLDGKINPKTVKNGVAAGKMMGLSYICQYSPVYGATKKALMNGAAPWK